MKRKIYETKCDKRKDQLAGFWIFTIVNVPILVFVAVNELLSTITFQTISSSDWFTTAVTILPWVINLVIISVGLLLRPQFATGFLVALAMWAIASFLYVPSCMATCIVIGGDYDSESFFYCFTGLYLLIWLGLGAWRSYKLYNRDCLTESE
jgi:hypothetical protein